MGLYRENGKENGNYCRYPLGQQNVCRTFKSLASRIRIEFR